MEARVKAVKELAAWKKQQSRSSKGGRGLWEIKL